MDYNEDFRLYLATRNPRPELAPDVVSLLSVVNFSTTRAGKLWRGHGLWLVVTFRGNGFYRVFRNSDLTIYILSAGLTGQLLAITIQHEKPQLEERKSQLLSKEESQKVGGPSKFQNIFYLHLKKLNDPPSPANRPPQLRPPIFKSYSLSFTFFQGWTRKTGGIVASRTGQCSRQYPWE